MEDSSCDIYKSKLDRSSKVPLYKQLYNDLKNRIVHKEIEEGDIFFSEAELIKMYEVSRITVRSALQLLEDDGYVKRSQGNSSIVRNRDKFAWNLQELTDDLRRFNDLKTEVKSAEITQVDEEVRENLQLPESSRFVYRIERLRTIDDIKMARSISYLVPTIPLDIDNVPFDDNKSITELLRTLGENPYYANETLEAINADHLTCKLLELPTNSAVFYRQRVTFNDEDTPLEYVQSFYNSRYTKYYSDNKLL